MLVLGRRPSPDYPRRLQLERHYLNLPTSLCCEISCVHCWEMLLRLAEEVSPFLQDEAVQVVPVSDTRFLMAIKAVHQLVRVDGLIDDVLCEPASAVPSVLLSLLELPQDSEVSYTVLYHAAVETIFGFLTTFYSWWRLV